MELSDIIDDVFRKMKEGKLGYQLVRFPYTGDLLLDLRNGVVLGEITVK